MSHDTIPHTNVMLEQIGRITGAWEDRVQQRSEQSRSTRRSRTTTPSSSTTSSASSLPDPAVREGLARFVNEGGGLGGIHGTPWASRNWDEFAEMIGAKSAPHRIEQGVMKVYDPASPIVKPFGGKPLNFREEYYRFKIEGPSRLRWEKVRVLLTVALDDPNVEPRPWTGYKRPDKIYPVTWIRSYGKGRVFYTSLGHMPETFMTPEIVGHFLAGVQFVLGDLDADSTPNPPQRTGARADETPPRADSCRRDRGADAIPDRVAPPHRTLRRGRLRRARRGRTGAGACALRRRVHPADLAARRHRRRLHRRGGELRGGVRERLNTLPLYQAGMIEFSIIPLNPYAGFSPARP